MSLPDQFESESPRGRKWLLVLGVLVLLTLAALFVWPFVEQELMKIPMTDGIAALRRGDMQKLRQSFTADADVKVGWLKVPVTTVLDAVGPFVREAKIGPIRFDGYRNMRRHGDTVSADFTVLYRVNDDDLPYRNIPARESGQVVLVKTGFFTWKIQEIGIRDLNLDQFAK